MTVIKAQLTKIPQTMNGVNLKRKMKADDAVGARLFTGVKALKQNGQT
jgi:hypothetical protein